MFWIKTQRKRRSVLFCVSVCRGPRPGGLRPGAAGRGLFSRLPRPVRFDAAQRGPTRGPSVSARLQEPAEPPDSGRELQPAAVQTDGWVRTKHTHMLNTHVKHVFIKRLTNIFNAEGRFRVLDVSETSN